MDAFTIKATGDVSRLPKLGPWTRDTFTSAFGLARTIVRKYGATAEISITATGVVERVLTPEQV